MNMPYGFSAAVIPPTAILPEKWRAGGLLRQVRNRGLIKLFAHVEPPKGPANEVVHKGENVHLGSSSQKW